MLEVLGDLVESPGDRGDPLPSCASCSRKSDHSSASDSFRLLLSGKKSVDNAGVLGVRCHGEMGTRKLGFDAPGLARPACSRCSAPTVSALGRGMRADKCPIPSDQPSKAAMI